jgi:hypothetical protein
MNSSFVRSVVMSLEAFAIPSPTVATRLYAVVGNPAEQGMARSLMNRLFVGRNVDALLEPIKAETSCLATVVEGSKSMGNLGGIKPAETRLLALAGTRGRSVHSCFHALAEQIALCRQFFRIP